MKIWFINSGEADYLQDLTYSGLVQLLGKSSVYEYPFNPRYHLPGRKKYPRNIGLEVDLLSLLKRKRFPPDLVILGSSHPNAFLSYLQIQKFIPTSTIIAFIDGGDEPEIGGDLVRLKSPELWNKATKNRNFDFIFKREKIKDHDYPDNVYPFPFSIKQKIYNKIPKNHKKYDVTFWAVESHPIRTQILSQLQSRFDCESNGSILNQKFRKYKRKGSHYLSELKASKISINLRGAGWDTLRFWELIGLEVFTVSQKLEIEIPHPFIHGEHIFYLDDECSNLIEACEFYLSNQKLAENISKNASDHAQKYHTHLARVQFLIDTVFHNL